MGAKTGRSGDSPPVRLANRWLQVLKSKVWGDGEGPSGPLTLTRMSMSEHTNEYHPHTLQPLCVLAALPLALFLK